MAISQLYPNQRPTLNLNFARSKTLDPRITFTRNSTATYVDSNGLIKTAAADEARFDHDENGDCRGLLIEESRTNLLVHTENFSSWSSVNGSVTSNTTATTAPDGSTNADKLSSSTGTWPTYIYQGFSGTGTTRALSVFAKAAESSWMALGGIQYGGEAAYFNLSTGSVGTVQGNVSLASMEDYGNGWYRCTVVVNFGQGNAAFGGVVPVTGDNTLNIVSSGDGIYLWGAQLEQGSFPTSYIPTSGSTVTRSADVASMTGTNFSSWYNQSEGTFVCEFNMASRTVTSGIYSLNDGTLQEQISHYNRNGLYGRFDITDNNAATCAIQTTSSTGGDMFGGKKTAFALKTGDNAAVVDGLSVMTDTGRTNTLPILTRLLIGSAGGSTLTNYTIPHMQRLIYYPYRLTDSQLQELTS